MTSIILLSGCLSSQAPSSSNEAQIITPIPKPSFSQLSIQLPTVLFNGEAADIPEAVRDAGQIRAFTNSTSNNTTECTFPVNSAEFWANCADRFAAKKLFNVTREYQFLQDIVLEVTTNVARDIPSDNSSLTGHYVNNNLAGFSGGINIDVYYERTDTVDGVNNCVDTGADLGSYFSLRINNGALAVIWWCMYADGSVNGSYSVSSAICTSNCGQFGGAVVSFQSNADASVKSIFVEAQKGVMPTPAPPPAAALRATSLESVAPARSLLDEGSYQYSVTYQHGQWRVQLGQHVQLWLPCNVPAGTVEYDAQCNEPGHEGLMPAAKTSVLQVSAVAEQEVYVKKDNEDYSNPYVPGTGNAAMYVVATDSDVTELTGDVVENDSIWKYAHQQYQRQGLSWPSADPASVEEKNPVYVYSNNIVVLGTRTNLPNGFPKKLLDNLNTTGLITSNPSSIARLDGLPAL